MTAALALVVVLRTERPLHALVARREVLLALMFVGNGRYEPHDFAPAWRPRLDDGVLDVRLVLAGHRFPVLRLAASLALGRLGRSRLYVEAGFVELLVTLLDGPDLLSRDGEVGLSPVQQVSAVARCALTDRGNDPDGGVGVVDPNRPRDAMRIAQHGHPRPVLTRPRRRAVRRRPGLAVEETGPLGRRAIDAWTPHRHP